MSVYYQNICALKNINLQVDSKSFLGIIGPNGGGKTTLLKVMTGLITPSSGTVKLFGESIEKIQNKIGYVPQVADFEQKFPVNVLEVVLMGRLDHKLRFFTDFSSRDKKKAKSLLKDLGMGDFSDRQIGQLSGGQLQKVLLARALAVEPEIMFLDEPTSSLDANATSEIYSILEELNKEITIVVVTHDLAAVSSYFDSIACLNKELHYHGDKELSREEINKTFGCPINLIAHGIPHQVLTPHEEESGSND